MLSFRRVYFMFCAISDYAMPRAMRTAPLFLLPPPCRSVAAAAITARAVLRVAIHMLLI